MSTEDDAYTRGGRHALMRAARFARAAGKQRTDAWLKQCADRWTSGFEAQWPDAPAYKGPVVHVDAPQADLRTLTADQLNDLLKAIESEQLQREVG